MNIALYSPYKETNCITCTLGSSKLYYITSPNICCLAEVVNRKVSAHRKVPWRRFELHFTGAFFLLSK